MHRDERKELKAESSVRDDIALLYNFWKMVILFFLIKISLK